VIVAATSLAAAASQPGCAEGGFRAALAVSQGPEGERWNALLGLQSLLLAQGRRQEVAALLREAVAQGQSAALGLYVVDAVAGYGMDAEAEPVVKGLAGSYGHMALERLWYHGMWSAHRGERERLDTIVRAIEARAATETGPDTVLASALGARLDLLRGDTAAAVRRLGRLVSRSPRPDLASGLWESLGSERLLLARLLLRQGDYVGAMDAAAPLDHPQPLVYLIYLPASLDIREQAARQLGRTRLADALAGRARSLASAGTP
jgi:hypothetical protein